MKLGGFDISASGLTAQRLRMDVIASNIANAETTRASFENGRPVPYRRKMTVMEPIRADFRDVLKRKLATKGVRVTQIREDPSPFKQVYLPTHPDADENGMVHMPNVDLVKEMVDLISATRSYEANVTALNASKAMFMKSLEIGRQ